MSNVRVTLSEQKLKDYSYLSPVEDLVNLLPHGSGFDGDWVIETDSLDHPQSIVLDNGYHAMDENGFYSGWLNFTIWLGKPGWVDMPDFEPKEWYHMFSISYQSDLADDIDQESLEAYIDEVISESLMGIVSAEIVEDEE